MRVTCFDSSFPRRLLSTYCLSWVPAPCSQQGLRAWWAGTCSPNQPWGSTRLSEEFALRGLFSGTVTVLWMATWGWGHFYHCNQGSHAGERTQQLPGRGHVRDRNFCPHWMPGQGGAPERGLKEQSAPFHLHLWKCVWRSRKWPQETAASPGWNAQPQKVARDSCSQGNSLPRRIKEVCGSGEEGQERSFTGTYSRGFPELGLWCPSL